MEVETVKVEHPGKRGFKSINKSDFDEKTHKLFKEKQVRAPRKSKKAE